MNTKLLTSALSSLAAAATLFSAGAAEANCEAPDRLQIDSIQFPSWSYDVGGIWEALPNAGISQGKCYKQEAGINNDPEVLFNYYGLWYVAIAESCDNLDANTWMAAFYGGPASDPTTPDFVRSLRTMRIEVAADDAYAVEFDGQFQTISLGSGDVNAVYEYGWVEVGVVEMEVSGELHTVEFQVADMFGTVAGVAAHITIDGGSCGDFMTGQDDFEYSTVTPTLGDTGICQVVTDDIAPFHAPPGSLGAAGADYVWWSDDATELGSAYVTIDIDVP